MRHMYARTLTAVAVLVGIAGPQVVTAAETGPSTATISLPPPTGPHRVGRTTFHWVDDRPELETSDPDDVRELMVHVHYPGDPDASCVPAPYVPDVADMTGQWDAAQRERVSSVHAPVCQDVAPLPGSERFPVVVFLSGGGVKVLTYTALISDLVSHGWVVAAVDQPYNPPAVRFPDGRVLRTLADAQRGWPPTDDPGQEPRDYRERNVHYARDVVFVIDRLGILDSSDGALAGRLALEPGVGVVGHSRGGQAAGTVRLLDARVRAGINIDGVLDLLPVQPAPDVPGMGRQPFLWIQSAAAIGVPTDEELAQQGLTRAGFNARLLGRLGATLAA